MKNFLVLIQQVDRRWLYLALALSIAVPILVPMNLPLFINTETRNFYLAVDNIPADKIVILMPEWDPSVQGELSPQTQAVIRHLFKKKIKFAIIARNPQGPKLAEDIAENLSEIYEAEYGKDWCNWGYKAGGVLMLQALAKDIYETIKKDTRETPIENVPMMQGVRDIKSVGVVVCITGYVGFIDSLIGFIQGPYNVPLVYGCTAVSAPSAYPYLDSMQLAGMLVGMRGAAEYENILGLSVSEARATKAMNSQSLGHMLVIFLIIIGNFAFLRRKRGAE